ncbi:hypothetical protein [Corynebacterium lowii]|uniref:hypothetical protein n=1 Tax=Corynebacterium lowii TaxID=1544413 RepID=UPI0027D91134|nr:hypothetical protein [Corynebacterium lowii]
MAGYSVQAGLELYEWNLQLASAVMHDVAHIEISVRNVYDQKISAAWDGKLHWLFDSSSPVIAPLIRARRRGGNVDLNARNRASIADARNRVRAKYPDPGQVIAELPFGFWRNLTDAAHEKSLWIPFLHHAFPQGTDRRAVEYALRKVNIVRNRASHHEPFFTLKQQNVLLNAQRNIVNLARMLLPPLADYIIATSTVEQVLAQTPTFLNKESR